MHNDLGFDIEELAIRTLAEARLTPAARLLLDDRLQARCRVA